MSGHSKWANIRVKKTAQDAKRGKVFTRYARLIEIAAREKGGDPGINARLRTLIDEAKSESVPNANIERAIKKGSGELKGEQMQEVVYEAYGPGGTAYIVECLTDNKNRTVANLKMILGRHGGHLAESGSVAWMFERRGLVIAELRIKNLELRMKEEFELELIDAGAEDLNWDDHGVRVVTGISDWGKVRDLLKTKGFEIESAGLSYVAKQKTPVENSAAAEKIANFIEALEEDDDVSEVHTNATAPVGAELKMVS